MLHVAIFKLFWRESFLLAFLLSFLVTSRTKAAGTFVTQICELFWLEWWWKDKQIKWFSSNLLVNLKKSGNFPIWRIKIKTTKSGITVSIIHRMWSLIFQFIFPLPVWNPGRIMVLFLDRLPLLLRVWLFMPSA